MARDAVFRSWQNDRAKHYRRINNIDDMLGTAVNVQAMVFGNLGDTSGTGVGLTRNPASGAKEFYGEFLMNAQGEIVIALPERAEALLHVPVDRDRAERVSDLLQAGQVGEAVRADDEGRGHGGFVNCPLSIVNRGIEVARCD